MNKSLRLLAATLLTVPCIAAAADSDPPSWTESQKPFKLYGNSYYVGTRGLTAVLITSDKGHVLIDGTVASGAPIVAANIRTLGFKLEDIKVILNTHDHHDHAGGIAELQRLSGAKVWASEESAKVMRKGEYGAEDPQFGSLTASPKVAQVSTFKDGETVTAGSIKLTAHLTPGHTAGGTSWSWQSCEGNRCLNMVYADSLSPVSAPKYRFTGKTDVLKQFERSYAVLADIPCDILVTPHPEMSSLWERLEKRESQGNRDALLDTGACDMYVEVSRDRLRKRLAEESAN